MSAADVMGGRLFETSVVGSYSVPEWLERLKTDYYQRRISAGYLREIHEAVIKAALKDQERAGIHVVSDGELRRDNDIDYFLARIPGVAIAQRAKVFYYDYYEATVTHPLPEDGAPLGLVPDLEFTKAFTDHPVKFSLTGPFSLAQRIRNEAYADRADLVMALARILHEEARLLAAAGPALLQIDEPFLAGHPDEVKLAVRAVNEVITGIDVPWALHVCYGNRYARPLWEGHYDFLFPAVLEADVDQLLLEFARKGYDDLEIVKRNLGDFDLGLGVIDVKSREIETPQVVASRILRAARTLPPERIVVNPDCGLRHLPPEIARAKLAAMTAGSAIARAELSGTRATV